MCGVVQFQVRLLEFDPEGFEESLLWTESGHLGRDFGCIRMMHDVDMGLDAALPRGEDGVRDGTGITLTEGAEAEGDTRSWKIVFWSEEANKTCAGLYAEPTCRIYCKADEGFSLTVRDGAVCLAPTDADDDYQHWIQDKRPGNRIKDLEGYPAFVLVNRVTGDAMDASVGRGNPVSKRSPLLNLPSHIHMSRLTLAQSTIRCLGLIINGMKLQFLESMLGQTFLSLTNFIEKIINTYNIK